MGAELVGLAGGAEQVQRQVSGWFRAHASDWQEVYRRADVSAAIHQYRMRLALTWTDRLGLAPGSRVLEVGCGAGLTSLALTQRGLVVSATDVLPAMLSLARQRAREAHGGAGLDLATCDAHALPFGAGVFDAVISLGVLPWLHSPPRALREIARVLKPGGHVIVSVENVWRLPGFLDPRLNPILRTPRRLGRSALSRAGLARSRRGIWCKRYSPGEFDALLVSVALERIKGATFGFGPFTFLGRHVLPNTVGNALNQHLQALANRAAPGLRWMGTDYMVLARSRNK